MHRSGISVTSEVSQAISNAAATGVGFFRIQLQDEAFTITHSGPPAADAASAFQEAKALLAADERAPAYLLLRWAGATNWVTIYYVPDLAIVRQKMLYASSRSSLKDGLNGEKFAPDYFISKLDEVSHEAYAKAQEEGDPDELLTREERMHAEARVDSHRTAGTVKLAAMGDIPISVDASVESALGAYKSGSRNCVYLSLDMKTEALTGRQAASDMKDLTDVHSQLPPKDGIYVLFKYAHQHESRQETADIFLYYCPDLAAPRNKMFYSSTKAHVMKVIERSGITITKTIEASEPKEVSDAFINGELYPQEHVKKTFSKPGLRGKGKRRLHRTFQT